MPGLLGFMKNRSRQFVSIHGYYTEGPRRTLGFRVSPAARRPPAALQAASASSTTACNSVFVDQHAGNRREMPAQRRRPLAALRDCLASSTTAWATARRLRRHASPAAAVAPGGPRALVRQNQLSDMTSQELEDVQVCFPHTVCMMPRATSPAPSDLDLLTV